MLDSFSIQSVKIIEDAKKIAEESSSKIVGSEHLLIAMFKTPDSICHFLLSELKISLEDIRKVLEKMVVIHKVEHPNITFTSKFQEIILNAKDLAMKCKSDYVYDEHMFYSLLELKDSVAYEILEMLNIDIPEMMDDIEEIFNFFDNDYDNKEQPFPFLKKIKKEGQPHPYIKRKDYIEQIIYILKKKQKNNPLLIGNAGVGKTAIVEGLASFLKDDAIYELELGSIVAGTKYRGELEEKLIKAMDFIKDENAILFIDEIHNIVGAGSNDGSLDIANILKPYLSSSKIKTIGATTLEEYYRYINKDKALTRRFQNIFIDEPTKAETLKILRKIKKYYEEYHNVKYSDELLQEIIRKSDIYIPNRVFPDKAIDVMDEVGAISNYHKIKNIEKVVDKVIHNMNGITPKTVKQIINEELNYPDLVEYYIRFIEKEEKIKNIVVAEVEKNFNIEPLLDDIINVFGVKKEIYLEIDLEGYSDYTSLNNLVGSSKGYVGYEHGGILLEHIYKYPLSIIYFKNISCAHYSIISYIDKIIQNSFVIDNKNRKISLSNTIFVLEENNRIHAKIGFKKSKEDSSKQKIDIKLKNKSNEKECKISERLVKKYNLKNIDKSDNIYKVIENTQRQRLKQKILQK